MMRRCWLQQALLLALADERGKGKFLVAQPDTGICRTFVVALRLNPELPDAVDFVLRKGSHRGGKAGICATHLVERDGRKRRNGLRSRSRGSTFGRCRGTLTCWRRHPRQVRRLLSGIVAMATIVVIKSVVLLVLPARCAGVRHRNWRTCLRCGHVRK